MRFELAVAIVLASSQGACSDSGKSGDAVPRKTDGPITLVPGDAGVSSTTIIGGTGADPSRLGVGDADTQRPTQPQPLPVRERRAIDVTLRSSPPGASVAVDGTAVGVTPAFWSGYADGREHQFVFSLPGHAIARYRFVPVSSGVIHARLDPIAEERDAGISPPPEVVPHPEPTAVAPSMEGPMIAPASDAGAATTPPATGSASPSTGSAPRPGQPPPPVGSGPSAGPGPQP